MSMCIFCNERPRVLGLGSDACQWCIDAAEAKAAQQAELEWEMQAISQTEAQYELDTILPGCICDSCDIKGSCRLPEKGSVNSANCMEFFASPCRECDHEHSCWSNVKFTKASDGCKNFKSDLLPF